MATKRKAHNGNQSVKDFLGGPIYGIAKAVRKNRQEIAQANANIADKKARVAAVQATKKTMRAYKDASRINRKGQ